MRKQFKLLTLASNQLPVAVNLDNIAFAVRVEDEIDGEKKQFTRIYLKQVVMNDENNWIDVTDRPEEIAKL